MVVPLPTTSVATPKQSISWKSGKLRGSVTVSGTVSGPATITVTIKARKGGKIAGKASFAATPGAWSKAIKLPPTLLPGAYDVTISGPAVQGSSTSFTLAAPATER